MPLLQVDMPPQKKRRLNLAPILIPSPQAGQQPSLDSNLSSSPFSSFHTRAYPLHTPRFVSQVLPAVDDRKDALSDTTARLYAPLPSPVIGRPPVNLRPFFFLGELRVGGHAVVYVARDECSGELVCLKRISKDAMQDNHCIGLAARNELLAYITIQKARNPNPYVMELFGTFQSHRSVFYAMDLMECSLYDMAMVEQRPTSDLIRRWMTQIAVGLDYIHSIGIIHRDMKPDNVLVSRSHDVRIADFGCAHVSKYTKVQCGRVYDDRWESFTLGYSSPEIFLLRLQHRGRIEGAEGYGPEIDWWGLGCIFLSMHQRIQPFTDEILEEYMDEHFRGRADDWLKCFTGWLVDDAEARIVRGLLRFKRDGRFALDDLLKERYFWRDIKENEFDYVKRRQRSSSMLRRPEKPRYQLADLNCLECRDLMSETVEALQEHESYGERAWSKLWWVNNGERGLWNVPDKG